MNLKMLRSIILSPSQANRVIEMFETLFPNMNCNTFETTDNEISTTLFEISNSDYTLSEIFTWLELLLFHISHRIYQKLGYENSTDYITINGHCPDENLVDHLYELFLLSKHS